MEARHMLFTAVAIATFFALGQCNPLGLRPSTCACQLQYGGNNPCCCSELLVRPPPPVRPPRAGPRLVCGTVPGAPILNPIGSACYCDTITVQPAIPPRPPCDLCAAKILQRSSGVITMADENQFAPSAPSCSCGQSDCNCCSCGTPGCGGGCGGGYGGGCGDSDIQYEGYATGATPADAVSLSLALSQQQRAQRVVREEALAFGFNQLPKDIPLNSKRLLRVQEERLSNWQAPAVELASVGISGCRDLEEEARDALLRAEQVLLEEALDETELAAVQPSLADIGYRPASISQPLLIPEYGCAGGDGLITLSPDGPSYALPIAYPEGRIVSLNYGEDESSYEDTCDDDDDYSREVVGSSSSPFISVAPSVVNVATGYGDDSYSQVIGLPQAPCGAQLIDIDRIPVIGCQDS